MSNNVLAAIAELEQIAQELAMCYVADAQKRVQFQRWELVNKKNCVMQIFILLDGKEEVIPVLSL